MKEQQLEEKRRLANQGIEETTTLLSSHTPTNSGDSQN